MSDDNSIFGRVTLAENVLGILGSRGEDASGSRPLGGKNQIHTIQRTENSNQQMTRFPVFERNAPWRSNWWLTIVTTSNFTFSCRYHLFRPFEVEYLLIVSRNDRCKGMKFSLTFCQYADYHVLVESYDELSATTQTKPKQRAMSPTNH